MTTQQNRNEVNLSEQLTRARDLLRQCVEPLSAWSYECAIIGENVCSDEERDSYAKKGDQVDGLLSQIDATLQGDDE